jgi:site-specific DNA-methyltransferase (adenine-specific)
MAAMDEASVDAIVTDPPYGLASGPTAFLEDATSGRGFMGKEWDRGVPGPAFWREALRVAKPGAYLLAFGGTRAFHRMAVAIEDAGWEIRDCVCWLYGSGFPKSHDASKAIDRAAGAEREVVGEGPNASRRPNAGAGVTIHMPSGDPITAPATDAAREWAGWGTALKPAWEPIIMARKPLVGTVAANLLLHGTGALNIDGARVGAGEGQGRWPANLMHDGSPEVVDRLGEASRFFYCAKASRADREEGCEQLPEVRRTDGRETEHHVPNLRTTALRNHHPTVKPTELMRYLIRLITPPGGTVLDPFMGSGSTGKAAMLEGATFRGCDLDPAYLAIAEARILFGLQLEAEEAAEAYESTRQLSLFGDP